MKILTEELVNRFKELGDQDIEDPIVVARFYTPAMNWEWYAVAYDDSDNSFFGYVKSDFSQMGDFLISELEEGRGPFTVLRDYGFKECKLSEVTKPTEPAKVDNEQ